jgi:ABC-2 type transport system ATP-binding protein
VTTPAAESSPEPVAAVRPTAPPPPPAPGPPAPGPPPPGPPPPPAPQPATTTPAGVDPAFVVDPTVEVRAASVWFGHKVALTELSCSFGPGVTGLLGPNGAGKTTLMRALTGLLRPNEGTVRVLGANPHSDRAVQAAISLVPEDEAVPPALTARQLVRYTAALHRVSDRSLPDRCLSTVGLLDVADRKVGGFSKGMRQRAKVAAALVTGPRVLVLDEPLNGADPVQRVALIDLFQALGRQGRTVIVSSHVLHEVERLASRQIVIIRGRLAAAGDHRAIRDSLADRPRSIMVRTPEARRLAAGLMGYEVVRGVTVDASSLVVSSARAGELAEILPRVARDAGARLHEVRPMDDSLESVFRELLR